VAARARPPRTAASTSIRISRSHARHQVDDDAIIWPPAILADLSAHRPELYGGVEFTSYQRPGRFVPSDMINWGGTYSWAAQLAANQVGVARAEQATALVFALA